MSKIDKDLLEYAIQSKCSRKELIERGCPQSIARTFAYIGKNSDQIRRVLQRMKGQSDIPKNFKTRANLVLKNDHFSVEEKETALCKEFNTSKELLNAWLYELGIENVSSQLRRARERSICTDKKRFIITSAQTASPVNHALFENMKVYAKAIDATIGVIATRYKNPTSIYNQTSDWWESSIDKYLIASRQNIHKRVSVLADVKIQATSQQPINSTALIEDQKSTIIGSPKIQMRPYACFDGDVQKFTYSTGSITYPSFSDTAIGAKAKEHHSFGFVVIEIESDRVVHIRSVSAKKDGSFNDLTYHIENGKITEEKGGVMIWGDSHVHHEVPEITKTFQNIQTDFGCKIAVLHDVFDSYNLNPHDKKNPFKGIFNQYGSLQNEFNHMFRYLEWFEKQKVITYVVHSNHNDMVDRMLKDVNMASIDKVDRRLFIEMLYHTSEGLNPKGAVAGIIDRKNYKYIKTLSLHDNLSIHGVELSLHGHRADGGAKGNINAFARMCTKTVTGHIHYPFIEGGAYGVGISCGDKHGYNSGASKWALSCCILNRHGKRQNIIINKESLTYTTIKL